MGTNHCFRTPQATTILFNSAILASSGESYHQPMPINSKGCTYTFINIFLRTLSSAHSRSKRLTFSFFSSRFDDSLFFLFGGASYTDDISDSSPASILVSELGSADYIVSPPFFYIVERLTFLFVPLSLGLDSGFASFFESGLGTDLDSGLALVSTFVSDFGLDLDFGGSGSSYSSASLLLIASWPVRPHWPATLGTYQSSSNFLLDDLLPFFPIKFPLF
jgi:hypothetical protein